MSNVDSMEIMFEGTVATGKNAFYMSGEIPKENTEGSMDSSNRKEFVDPNVNPLRMLTQWRLKAHHRRG